MRSSVPHVLHPSSGCRPPNYFMLAGIVAMAAVFCVMGMACLGIFMRDYRQIFTMPPYSFSDSVLSLR